MCDRLRATNIAPSNECSPLFLCPFFCIHAAVRRSARPSVLLSPDLLTSFPGSLWRGLFDEAVLSASQQAPDQHARVPRQDGHALGPRGAFAPAEEGPEAAHRLAAVEARRLLTASARLPRAHRLARASDIRRCLATGRRRRLEHLDMIWTDNLVGHPRMGLIVPKFQSSAVARNRLRRRLREIWRRDIQPHQPAWDLVIRARREAYAATYPALRDDLRAWRRATLAAG